MKRVLVPLRDVAQYATDPLVVLGSRTEPSHHRLITVRVDGLGDLVLWLPMARTLRDALGPARQAIVVRHEWVALCEALEIWDDVVGVDADLLRRSPRVRMAELAKVSGLSADVVLNPMDHMHFSDAEAIVRRITSPMKVGWALDGWAWRGTLRDRAYDHTVVQGADVWQADRNHHFVRAVLGLIHAGEPGASGVRPHPLCALAGRLGRPRSQAPSGDFVVVFPRTGSSRRNPDPGALATAVGRIIAETEYDVVVLGDDPESELMARLEGRSTRLGSRVVELTAGSVDLLEVVRLVAACSLVVGGDSAGAHLAAAVGVPSVVVLGGGHFGRFFPYGASWVGTAPNVVVERWDCFGCAWTCTVDRTGRGTFPCVAALAPERIWTEVAGALT